MYIFIYIDRGQRVLALEALYDFPCFEAFQQQPCSLKAPVVTRPSKLDLMQLLCTTWVLGWAPVWWKTLHTLRVLELGFAFDLSNRSSRFCDEGKPGSKKVCTLHVEEGVEQMVALKWCGRNHWTVPLHALWGYA